MKMPKQAYMLKFKELAVKRVKDGQALSAVAKELCLVEQTLRNWVKAAAAGKLAGAGGKAVTPEEMELSRLRAENLRLKRELEIKKSGGVGWPLKPRMTAEIAIEALTMAWFSRRPAPRLLHHSDR